MFRPTKRPRFGLEHQQQQQQQRQVVMATATTSSQICWMDCDMVSVVPGGTGDYGGGGGGDPFAPATLNASPSPCVVQTSPSSMVTQEIFMERFEKEIVLRFGFTASSQIRLNHNQYLGDEAALRERVRAIVRDKEILKTRVLFGVNECTRRLERHMFSSPSPSSPVLIVIASADHNPASSVLSHIPVMARQCRNGGNNNNGVPVLILPGVSASRELGELLCTKHVTVITFLSRPQQQEQLQQQHQQDELQQHCCYGDHIHSAVDSFVDFIKKKVPT